MHDFFQIVLRHDCLSEKLYDAIKELLGLELVGQERIMIGNHCNHHHSSFPQFFLSAIQKFIEVLLKPL
jgi:hypothetical protein